MLQSIREYTQGWIAGVIISIIILTFALWGIHSYFQGFGTNNVVAEVNGVDITKEQLAVTYERMRRQSPSQYGTKNETALKNRALDLIIDTDVLKQASTAQGFLISDAQIDNYLQNMPEFQVDGKFSFDRFQELISSTLLSTSEFLDLIKVTLLIDQPKLGIVFTSFALPDETNYTIALVNQERDIDYATMSMQYFLSQVEKISPEKIKAYYNAHQSDFMTPEQVSVEYLELSSSDLASRITPTDSMLKNFYNENINSYTQPMKWKLAELVVPVTSSASTEEVTQAQKRADAAAAALKNGDDFTKVAQMYGQGQVGRDWLSLNDIANEAQKAVAGLTAQDQVSDPVRTNKGFVVLKVIAISEPTIQAYAEVQDKVRDAYIRQHAEEKFAELRDQLNDRAYENPTTLKAAAESLNLPIKTSELFNRDKAGKDISQYKKVRDIAFSNDVLNLQNNSDVIQINPDTVVVIRVKSHIAPAMLPLNGVSSQIENKLRTEQAEQAAAKAAQEILAELKKGDEAAIASLKTLKWTSTGYIGRYSKVVDSAILDLAFSLPNPASQANKVSYGSTRLPNGYAIVAVKGVKDGVVEGKKQYMVFAEQVQNSQGLLEYELYRQSQVNSSKIKVYQK